MNRIAGLMGLLLMLTVGQVWAQSPAWRSVSRDDVTVWAAPGIDPEDASAALQVVSATRLELLRDYQFTRRPVTVYLYATVRDYRAATRRPAWMGAMTRNREIHMQPPSVLDRRGVLATTLRRETLNALVDDDPNTPSWLREGLAVWTSGELPTLPDPEPIVTLSSLNAKLLDESDGYAQAQAMSTAGQAVGRLVHRFGKARVGALLRSVSDGMEWQTALQAHLQLSPATAEDLALNLAK